MASGGHRKRKLKQRHEKRRGENENGGGNDISVIEHVAK